MPRPPTWNRQEWRAWHAGGDGPGSPAALALPVLATVAGPETGRWPQHDLDALKAIALLRQVRREVDDETQGWLLIARGRGLPWEAIAEALGVTPQAARQRWAEFEDPAALAELAGHRAISVRRGVAAHPATPVPSLERLADDPDPAVRAAVAANPAAPPATRSRAGLLAD